MIRTMGFPRSYSQGPGALGQLPQALADLGAERPACVADPIVREIVGEIVNGAFAAAGLHAAWATPPCECTLAGIGALSETIAAAESDCVVAFGGGKAIDASKGVALRLSLPIVVCPTVASSDAPTSGLIVHYDEAHRVAGVERLRQNPDAVLVDTDVIARSPPRLFAAGVGDALSKRFEAWQCRRAGGRNSFGTPPLDTALLLADAAYATLQEWAPAAYGDVVAQRRTQAVERVVEATVLLSGLGFESGGLSLAHALIRGLTTVPELADRLHGELVAYATLVQLAFEQRPEPERLELVAILRAVDLPSTLAALGRRTPLTPSERAQIAAATLGAAYAANTDPPLTAAALLAAIDRVEDVGASARVQP